MYGKVTRVFPEKRIRVYPWGRQGILFHPLFQLGRRTHRERILCFFQAVPKMRGVIIMPKVSRWLMRRNGG